MTNSSISNFWKELLRRKVIRTGLSYAITAWLVIQVLDVILPAFNTPDWVLRAMITILALGLPIAMVVAWSFDIRPASEASDTEPAPSSRSGVNVYLAVVGLYGKDNGPFELPGSSSTGMYWGCPGHGGVAGSMQS